MRERQLPSVETQTVAFVETSRKAGRRSTKQLSFRGFSVYLRYAQAYTSGEMVLGETLVIANVQVPVRFRNRGWFLHYCELCLALIEDAVVIECVNNPYLYASLSRREAFKETKISEFVLLKRHTMEGSRSMTMFASPNLSALDAKDEQIR
ncbi:MAG: hypothetical protein ACYCSZ_13095 [Burkholderiales bacterium]